MAKLGRPSGYDPKYCAIAQKMCELGAVDQEIAEAFQVSVRTLYRWRAENEDFCHSLKAGKEPADNRVEAALYHRAVGYTHDEDDLRVVGGELVITPTKKHYPPDTKAALAWLYNRKPDSWHPLPQASATGEALTDVLSKLIDKLPD